MSFYRTQLSGPIPPEIGALASLEHLLIGINDISGPIPTEIGNLAKLKTLTITLTRSNRTVASGARESGQPGAPVSRRQSDRRTDPPGARKTHKPQDPADPLQ